MIATRRRIVTVLALAAAGRVPAQAPRRLAPVQDLRIATQSLGAREILVALAPDGHIVVAPRYGGLPVVGFDSLGNKLSWKIPIGGRDDAEILFPSRIGFIGRTDTMWIADAGFRQVALIDGNGKVFKSLENPSWVHPTWVERRKYPVFANSQAFAIYKDESMLLLPGRERALLDTPGYDRTGLHLLRTSWSGSIQRTVAMVPDIEDRVAFHGKGCEHTTVIPFGVHTMWGVSIDGSRLAVVKAGLTAADSGTVRVTSLSDRGDTIFSHVISQPAVRVPQATIDNLLASQRACGAFTVEAVRDSVSRRISTFKSFVTSVLPGRDQTTWVVFRAAADTSTERTAVGLDDKGEVIGAVTLPLNQLLVGADRSHLWMLETGRMKTPVALVRYRLDATPAPPPRSARAASPSGTSRPRE